jgi:hypothetical protein
MKNLISQAMSFVGSLFSGLQVKQLLSIALVGFFLLTSPVATSTNSKAASDRINAVAHQNDSDRPKTTGEWKQEARQVDKTGNRLERIGKESAEAVKDWGGLYPDTAERSAQTLDENQARSNSRS